MVAIGTYVHRRSQLNFEKANPFVKDSPKPYFSQEIFKSPRLRL